MATDANASLISKRSTWSGVRFSRPNALPMAFAGWDNSDGSGPATVPCAPISARIGAPSSSALARDITTTAAAPSEIWDDEPAVTVPSWRTPDAVSPVSPPWCPEAYRPRHSLTITGSPLRCGTSTVTISSSNKPFFCASAARHATRRSRRPAPPG